jgi:APA family basic amino acid/polyamine antiporter
MAVMASLLVLAVAVAGHYVRGVDVAAYDWEIVRRVVESLQNDTVFDLLTNFVIFTVSIFYLFTVLAVIVLRLRRPDAPRPYRTWGYPLVPLAFMAVYVWFLGEIYWSKPLEAHTGLVLIALGIPVYAAYRAWAARQTASD